MNNTLKLQSCRPGCSSIQLLPVCFDLSIRQAVQLSSAYFQLLQPLLSFKDHRITVLKFQPTIWIFWYKRSNTATFFKLKLNILPKRGQNTHKFKSFSIMSGAHKPVGSGSLKNINCQTNIFTDLIMSINKKTVNGSSLSKYFMK